MIMLIKRPVRRVIDWLTLQALIGRNEASLKGYFKRNKDICLKRYTPRSTTGWMDR